MEIVLLLVALPWLILFDTIPKMFGYSGLIDWYIEEFGGYADIVLMFYVCLTLLCIFIHYII